MTRDDIIRMAREAGIKLEDEQTGEYSAFDQELERFAALVSAAERKACTEHCLSVMHDAVEKERK